MKALITGIAGQDGPYLAELLLAKGYEVHGLVRQADLAEASRIGDTHPDVAAHPRFRIVVGDLLDKASLIKLLREIGPDEVYNLAGQSNVEGSFSVPELTAEINGIGALRLLEALREASKEARMYQASSSELFGHAVESPQNESTPFRPRSPYGAAKLFAYWMMVNYRQRHGMFAANGLLFNHESPRRSDAFVTRKISKAVANIAAGKQDFVELGNLDARRDWGYAGDHMDAVWRMLQHPEPDDFVIATGELHTVREFVELAFGCAGIDWREHVRVNPDYVRPAEQVPLVGDASKALRELGWRPKVTFKQLVTMMVESDMARIR